MMTRAFVVAATLSIAAPALAQSEYREGPIAPGEHLALRISADGAVSVESDPAVDLPAAAAAAVEEAPPWLRPDLADALRRADPSDREALAALVLEAGDPLLVDEIAFVASHLAPEDMDGADLEMIAENAAVIYEVAPELAYVDIVEVEDGGDWYTTLSYHVVETGGEGEWTLDRDDYYRWVVMPMLDDGAFRYVDPSSGSYADPPGGRSYRDYIWHDADDYRSYGLQVALRRPNTIDDEWLDGAGFGETAPAHGILSGFEVDPIVLVRDEATGRAAAVAFI